VNSQSHALTAIAWTATHSIWLTLVTWLVTMAGCVWYARSSPFVADPSRSLMPLRRDEREQAITHRAATYAFVAAMLLRGLLGMLNLPMPWASVVVLAGFAVYFVARVWLRHVM